MQYHNKKFWLRDKRIPALLFPDRGRDVYFLGWLAFIAASTSWMSWNVQNMTPQNNSLSLHLDAYPPTFQQPPAIGDIGGGNIAFHVLTTRRGLARYLYGHSQEWLAELRSVGSLVFSVGRSVPGEADDDERMLAEIRSYLPDIFILELDVSDEEYPPLLKTLAAFDHLSRHVATAYDFVYNLDDDTHFHPLRMAALVASRNASEPLYMGRPLCNCLCEPPGTKCTAAVQTRYCSGAGYAFSSATLRFMKGLWKRCWEDYGSLFSHCRSSDTFIGLCMNRLGGQGCSPAHMPMPRSPDARRVTDPRLRPYVLAGSMARANKEADPPLGVSWACANEQGHEDLLHTLLCNDRTHVGGLRQRQHLASPHLMSARDSSLCAYFHPVKVNGMLKASHQRYVRYLMNGATETALWTWPPPPERPSHMNVSGGRTLASIIQEAAHCRLAISIHSDPSHVVERYVLRRTWMRVARSIAADSTVIRFILGFPSSPSPLPPHVQDQLNRELARERDVIQIDSRNGSHGSLMAWYHWALNTTDCDYIARTGDVVYVRLLPLFNYLESLGPGPVDDVYFGKMTGSLTSHSSTLGGMKSRLPTESAPSLPYTSGGIWGLSRNLAQKLLYSPQIQATVATEEAIGASISALVHDPSNGSPIKHPTDRNPFGVDTCTENRVWDSPEYSKGFKLYSRYEDDLAGEFCSRWVPEVHP